MSTATHGSEDSARRSRLACVFSQEQNSIPFTRELIRPSTACTSRSGSQCPSADHDLVSAFQGDRLRNADHFGVERIGDVVDQESNGPGVSRTQCPGVDVRDVVQLLCGRKNPLPCPRTNSAVGNETPARRWFHRRPASFATSRIVAGLDCRRRDSRRGPTEEESWFCFMVAAGLSFTCLDRAPSDRTTGTHGQLEQPAMPTPRLSVSSHLVDRNPRGQRTAKMPDHVAAEISMNVTWCCEKRCSNSRRGLPALPVFGANAAQTGRQSQV